MLAFGLVEVVARSGSGGFEAVNQLSVGLHASRALSETVRSGVSLCGEQCVPLLALGRRRTTAGERRGGDKRRQTEGKRKRLAVRLQTAPEDRPCTRRASGQQASEKCGRCWVLGR